jgi:hypothetical protein
MSSSETPDPKKHLSLETKFQLTQRLINIRSDLGALEERLSKFTEEVAKTLTQLTVEVGRIRGQVDSVANVRVVVKPKVGGGEGGE